MMGCAAAVGVRDDAPPGGLVPDVDEVVRLFCRGRDVPAVERENHALRVAWEIGTGRWVARFDAFGRCCAYLAWVQCNGRGRMLLKRAGSVETLARRGAAFNCARGTFLYVADAAVAPWAGPGALLSLVREARARVPAARWMCAHVRKRDGGSQWRKRRLIGG